MGKPPHPLPNFEDRLSVSTISISPGSHGRTVTAPEASPLARSHPPPRVTSSASRSGGETSIRTMPRAGVLCGLDGSGVPAGSGHRRRCTRLLLPGSAQLLGPLGLRNGVRVGHGGTLLRSSGLRKGRRCPPRRQDRRRGWQVNEDRREGSSYEEYP